MNGPSIGRRRFLRGAGGIALGLPLLESLSPRKAWAAPPRRLAIMFQCNGVNMERWFPAQPYGRLTAAGLKGTALEPLTGYIPKLLVPRGMHTVPRGYGRDPAGGDDHMKGMGHKLTACPNSDVKGSFYPTGPSIDFVIAKGINPAGKVPFNLAVGPSFSSSLGSAFYTDSGQPSPMFRDPWKAFKDWAGSGSGEAGGTIDRTAKRRQSVLDVVKGQLDDLKRKPQLTADDRRKLDLHFTTIRTLETASSGTGSARGCGLPEPRLAEVRGVDPGAVTKDVAFPKIAEMMVDLMALAAACDYNRVVTLQLGRGAGGPVYSFLGDELNQRNGHHSLSHGTSDSGASVDKSQYLTSLFNIDLWHSLMMKRLLDRLSGYAENGGTVLDNTAVLYINELSDGRAHSYKDLPCYIAGGAGGYFKQGEYVKMVRDARTDNDIDAPFNKMLTTLANAVGYRTPQGQPLTNFGKAASGREGEYTELKA